MEGLEVLKAFFALFLHKYLNIPVDMLAQWTECHDYPSVRVNYDKEDAGYTMLVHIKGLRCFLPVVKNQHHLSGT